MGEGDVGLAQGVVVVDSWGGVDEGDLVRVEGGDGGAAGDDAGVCGRELAEEGGEGAVDAGLPVDEGAVDVEGEGLEGGEGRGGGHDGCSGGAAWGGGVYPGREEIWSIIYLVLYVCLCVPRRMWWLRCLLYVLLRAPFEVRRRRCSDPCKGEGDSRRRYDFRSTEYDERSTIRRANPLFNWRISVLSLEDDQEDLANDIICAQYVVMSVCNNLRFICWRNTVQK